MKNIIIFFFLLFAFTNLYAQAEFEDGRTYEIRFWQNMGATGSNPVMVDTMVYYGSDRTGFDYSSADCVSYFCKDEDNMIYTILQEMATDEKEWYVKNMFIRKIRNVQVPFRGKKRTVYWVYVSDMNNRNTGVGTYSLVSPEFGVICRWNSDGEFFQLNRIDVVYNGVTQEELDMMPMLDKLYVSDIFTNQ